MLENEHRFALWPGRLGPVEAGVLEGNGLVRKCSVRAPADRTAQSCL